MIHALKLHLLFQNKFNKQSACHLRSRFFNNLVIYATKKSNSYAKFLSFMFANNKCF